MPNIRISDMPPVTVPLTGNELIEAVQNGFSRQMTVDDLVAITPGLDATFITLSANVGLANERILTAGTGITLVDGGAGNPLTINVSGAALEPSALFVSGVTQVQAFQWGAYIKTLETFPSGIYTGTLEIRDNAGAVSLASLGFTAGPDLRLQSLIQGAFIELTVTASGGATLPVLYAGPDAADETTLYVQGSRQLELQTAGITSFYHTTAASGPTIRFRSSDETIRGDILTSSSAMNIRNRNNSGPLLLGVLNGAGQAITSIEMLSNIISFDIDNTAGAGRAVVRMARQLVQLSDDSSGGVITPKTILLEFSDSTFTLIGSLGYNTSLDLVLANELHAGSIILTAQDTGGITRSLFTGDPDGSTGLYNLGVETARTLAIASGGFEVNNTLTGAGFERVLTLSDIGGGQGMPLADTWLFDSNLTASAPINQSFKFNNAVPASISVIRVDDDGGNFSFDDMEQWVVPGSHFRVYSLNDVTEYWDFVSLAAPVDRTGYWDWNINFVGGSTTQPINGTQYVLQFSTLGFVDIAGTIFGNTGDTLVWDVNFGWRANSRLRVNSGASVTDGSIRIDGGNFSLPPNGGLIIKGTATSNAWFFETTALDRGYYCGATGDILELGYFNGSSLPALRINSSNSLTFPATAQWYLEERATPGNFAAGFGQIWVKDTVPNQPWFTDDVDIDYPVATAKSKRRSNTATNMNTAGIAEDLTNGELYFDDGANYTVTLENSAGLIFEVDQSFQIINAGTGTITISEGTGDTLFVLDGAAGTVTDAAGSATMGTGGVATVSRKAAGTWIMWGSGITP